jgi:hypothetical protein
VEREFLATIFSAGNSYECWADRAQWFDPVYVTPVFYLMPLPRYSPRGQRVHENDPTMSDDQKSKKYMMQDFINVINHVADEHFRRSDDQPLLFRHY